MFTTCPKCSLTLVVTTADLRAAQGFVRCGRCSNVFNALANLSEDRAANAETANTGQQRILQQQPPIDFVESGTPEESPRYEEAPRYEEPPAPPPPRTAPQPNFTPPSQPQLQRPSIEHEYDPLPQRAAAPKFEPPPQQRPPAPQPSAQRTSAPTQTSAPRAPSQPQTKRAPGQQTLGPRGVQLPPPTAEDLDQIPDISLEFDAQSTDISQVFVQQPARRVVMDGNTGTFETVALKETPPAEDADDDGFGSQLRALAAQLSPNVKPPEHAPPARNARAAKQNVAAPPARDTGATTGSNPILRMRPPASDASVARQTQAAPAQVAPQAKQTPAPSRDAPAAPRAVPARDPSSTGSNPVLRVRTTLNDVPVEDLEPVVRQSTGAPSADPQPIVRQSTGTPSDAHTQARQANGASADAQTQARQANGAPSDTQTLARQSNGAPSDVQTLVRQSNGAPSDVKTLVRQTAGSPARESPPRKPERRALARGNSSSRAVAKAAPERKGRSPEELIQAAAEVVRRAGRKRAVANGGDVGYNDDMETDLNIVPDISESFPTRIRRRAFEAIETDGAALRARIPSLSWGAAAVALSALFVFQVINHYRSELATSDRLRKPLTSLYGALGVKIVPRWDIGAYEVRQLGALAGGGTPSRLTVRLSVKNGAKSAQPLPYLRVTVQDRFGNRVASRDVPPQVYSPKRAGTLLDADSRIDAEVAFVDPGQSAVGFEIDACLPAASGRIACANDQIAR